MRYYLTVNGLIHRYADQLGPLVLELYTVLLPMYAP
jgi:hypothetical protein